MSRTPAPPLPFVGVVLNGWPRHYRCPREWSWRDRVSDYDMWIVLGGKGELKIDGVVFPVHACQAVLMRPGEKIEGRHDGRMPLEVVALHFTPRGGKAAALACWAEQMRSLPLKTPSPWRELAELCVTELEAQDELAKQQSQPLVMTLLTCLWRRANAPLEEEGDDRLETLVKNIQREPEKEWLREKILAAGKMGATRLNQRFRDLTGFSPAAWVIRCRIERAKTLLRHTDLKVAAVAETCGYRDVFFFSRQFKQITGQSPAAWRQTA